MSYLILQGRTGGLYACARYQFGDLARVEVELCSQHRVG
jgi:hypothetical protein